MLWRRAQVGLFLRVADATTYIVVIGEPSISSAGIFNATFFVFETAL
jgi:hypothetical protein